jgi:hypothetical protein
MSHQVDADYTKVFMFPPSLELYVNIPEEYNWSADRTSEDAYHTNNFAHDKQRHAFVCPHGVPLRRASVNGDYVQYACTGFAGCHYAAACTKSQNRKQISVHRQHEAICRRAEDSECTSAVIAASAWFADRAGVRLDKGAVRVTQAAWSRVGKCEGIVVHGLYRLQHTKDMDNGGGTGHSDVKTKG